MFNRRIKKIGKIDFDEIVNFWGNFTHLIDFPVTLPLDKLESNTQIIEVCNEVIETENNSTVKDHFFSIDGVQSFVLQEAVVNAYKGLNVSSVVGSNIKNGFQTWPMCNAYQASFFLKKSILAFLGISIIRVSNKDFILNLIPTYSRKESKSSVIRRKADFEFRIIPIKQITHYEAWELFQRVINDLRQSEEIINNQMIYYLTSLDSKMFAKQRNENIYFSNYWKFEDLKVHCSKMDKFISKIFNDEGISLSTDSEYFTFSITYMLLHMCQSILNKLGTEIPAFDEETTIFNNLKNLSGNNLINDFLITQEL